MLLSSEAGDCRRFERQETHESRPQKGYWLFFRIVLLSAFEVQIIIFWCCCISWFRAFLSFQRLLSYFMFLDFDFDFPFKRLYLLPTHWKVIFRFFITIVFSWSSEIWFVRSSCFIAKNEWNIRWSFNGFQQSKNLDEEPHCPVTGEIYISLDKAVARCIT